LRHAGIAARFRKVERALSVMLRLVEAVAEKEPLEEGPSTVVVAELGVVISTADAEKDLSGSVVDREEMAGGPVAGLMRTAGTPSRPRTPVACNRTPSSKPTVGMRIAVRVHWTQFRCLYTE
jgi:hypothetical protein